ncbi:MAG: FecR family protein, partial [Butyricimonas paravirosa]
MFPREEYNLILSDGTWVYLNAESVIVSQNLSGKREVILEGGIFKDASKERPFVVKTKDMDVLVTGTEFNVKAYPDESNVQTTLLRGKVAVFAGIDKKEKIEIKPNQQAEWSRENVKLQVREVDPDLFVAWKNGHFIFRQDRLENIMKTLARWYDMEVVYLDESIKNMAFAGK